MMSGRGRVKQLLARERGYDEWGGKGKAVPNKGERMMSGRRRVKQFLTRERG